MVNRIPFSVSDDTIKSTEVITIEEVDDTRSMSSFSSSSSSLGFGDFENGTIYDQIAELDAPIHESFAPGNGASVIDKAVVKNSKGVVFGNSVIIEGTVIFDRVVPETQKDLDVIADKNDLSSKNKESTIEEVTVSENQPQKSKIRRKIVIAVVVLSVSVVIGVLTVLVTHFISF